MIMPFIRLITIYVFVGLAVFIVFNRDAVKQLVGIAGDRAEVAYSDPSLPPIPPAAPSADAPAAPVADSPVAPTPAKVIKAQAQPAPDAVAANPAAVATTPEVTVTDRMATTPPVAHNTPASGVKSTAIATTSTAPDTVNSRLMAARTAYWNGDKIKAEGLYRALVAEFPERVDFAGELGNIYFVSGRYNLAARYYKVVTKALLANSDSAQAQAQGQAMLAVLQAIAPKMADDLRANAANAN